jgi:hypothetical protein
MPTGVSFSIPANNGTAGHATTQTSLFLYIPSAPAGNTTILDYDLSSGDYFRLRLATTRHLWLEFQKSGYGSATVDLGAVPVATWTWITCGFKTSGGLYIRGDVTPVGGATSTATALASSGSATGVALTGVPFGVGVTLTSAYADFPNNVAGGWLCSKLIQTQIASNAASGNPEPMPVTDYISSYSYREYLGHDALGTQTTLSDSGTAAIDLVAGIGGLTIVDDGPALLPSSPGPANGHKGDLVYYHLNAWQTLHVGTTGQALTVVTGEPAWGTIPQTTVQSESTEAATNDTLTGGTSLLNQLNRLRYQLAQLGTGAWNTLRAMVQLSPSSQQTGTINVSGEIQGSDLKAGGLTGATQASRYVGATTSGAPASGTFAKGDFVLDQTGKFWVCTTAGTPGTWTQVAGSGGSVTSVALTMPSEFSVSGSPITGAGTLAVTKANESANQIFAGPTSGGAAAPTFRSMVSSDLPSAPTVSGEVTGSDFKASGLTGATAASRYVGGTASGAPASGTFAVGDFVIDQTGKAWICTVAGTPGTWTQLAGGLTTLTTEGDLLYYHSGANARLPVGSNGQSLQVVSGDPAWVSTTAPGALMPAVSAYNSVAQSIPNNTETYVTFDTTQFDQGTATPQHNISTNTSRLTCQQAGIYQIDFSAEYASNSTGTRYGIMAVNRTTDIDHFQVTPNSGQPTDVNMSTLYQLNVGDYIEVRVFQNSGGALNLSAGSQLPQLKMARIDSGPGALQPNTKVQLDWAASTDINGVALTATTWTDTFANQTFTVDDPNSVVEISVGGYAQVYGATNQGSSRIVIDSAGTPITKMLGSMVEGSSVVGVNILAGTNIIPLTGLAAGPHTIKVQVWAGGAGSSLYCRASSFPNNEFLNIRVLERKQSSSPPSSTPAPAVRCYNSANISVPNATWTALTLDNNRYDQGTSVPQHSTATNTSRLICQQAGVYQINGNIWFPANNTGSYRIAAIRLNGTLHLVHHNGVVSAGMDARIAVSTEWQLSVGDYVELIAYQDSGGSLNVLKSGANEDWSPEFSMARIDSGPGAVQPNTKVQLDYAQISNVSLTPSASTWTDYIGNQTFTVDDPNSVVEISVGGTIVGSNASSDTDVAAQIVVDSAGASITKFLGGARVKAAVSFGVNALSGSVPVTLTGLAAGSHTVKVQVFADNASTSFQCYSTGLGQYGVEIRVLERKQSTSPPSSTPAPAVRCYNSAAISVANATFQSLTFDTNRYDHGTSTPQHSVAANTSRLTCQQAGVYQIGASVDFAGSASGSYRMLELFLNGTTLIGKMHSPFLASSGIRVEVNTQYNLAVGDYVEVHAYQDSGGALNVNATPNQSPEFWMARVDTGALPSQQWITKSVDYTLLPTDYGGILADATSGNRTMTLPTAVGAWQEFTIKKKDSSANTVTVATTSSQTIDGASTYVISTQYESVTVVSDSANWFIK